MLVASESDVRAVLSLADLVLVVADAVRAQGREEVERPARSHSPVGVAAGEPAGTGLVMPAYIHGAESVGSAAFDAASAVHLHERLVDSGRGVTVEL